jgi:hypothetical protein
LADYTPVTHEAFAGKSWQRNEDFSFAKQQTLLPLIANEAGIAACSVPMAFAEISGKMTLVMICSLQPSQNLMVAPNGKWAIGFVPAVLRCHPFRLASSGEKYALAVDASSDLVSGKEDGIPFFQEDGAPSAETKAVLQLLLSGHQGQAMTQRAATALAEANLLEPWNIVIREKQGERQVSGLSKVNESTLSALTDEQFLLLRQSGALAIAYAQLISIHQLALLKRLSDMHAASSANHAEHSKLFSPEGSAVDEKFDWQALFKDPGT